MKVFNEKEIEHNNKLIIRIEKIQNRKKRDHLLDLLLMRIARRQLAMIKKNNFTPESFARFANQVNF